MCGCKLEFRGVKMLAGWMLMFMGMVCSSLAAEDITTHISPEKLQPFLEKNCISCHGPEEQEGQVRLDELSWAISDNDTAQRWQDVLDQLNSGDMPPWDADVHPEDDELIEVLGILTKRLQVARKKLTATGGEIQMRRLNQREYAETIKHLFGFTLSEHDIPEDGEGESFDTAGNDLLFSSAYLEKYLELGRRVAKASFDVNAQRYKEPKRERSEPEKKVNQSLRKKVADGDKKRAIKEAGGTWEEMGFKDEGDMQILFRQWDSRIELPRSYLSYPKIDQGVYLSGVVREANANRHVDPRAEYVIRIRGGVHDPDNSVDDLRRVLKVGSRDESYGTLMMHGTAEKPEVVELKKQIPLGKMLSVRAVENLPEQSRNNINGYVNVLEGKGERTDPRAALWVDWVETEGPFYPEKRPIIEDLFFPGVETGANHVKVHEKENIRAFIKDFSYHAFRRAEPQPEYVDALHAYYEELIDEKKMKSKQATMEVMAVILSSPRFLYINEEKAAHEETSVSNRELAVRLSYFLWSTPPDEALYAANLQDASVHAAQVERLLADPRSRAFKDGFISQWAEFDRYDSISIDHKKIVRFNEGLKHDAKREVQEFFSLLIEENLPIDNFIDSDFLTINEALAVHYDLPFPKTAGKERGAFLKVPLPEGSPRGGLLTQAAFLIAGSNGERSSPVIRGSLIMEKFLHDKPAPPPPNVPELGVDSKEPHSNRELVSLHQSEPTCASCHSKIDPVGFGLENFDTIGRWQEKEKVGKKGMLPIDPSGKLPTGESYTTVQEFKTALLSAKDSLAEELIKSFLSYGMGRSIEFSDQQAVDRILAKCSAGNYKTRDLIKEVAMSELFKGG